MDRIMDSYYYSIVNVIILHAFLRLVAEFLAPFQRISKYNHVERPIPHHNHKRNRLMIVDLHNLQNSFSERLWSELNVQCLNVLHVREVQDHPSTSLLQS